MSRTAAQAAGISAAGSPAALIAKLIVDNTIRGSGKYTPGRTSRSRL